jgi:hypothetical protein
MPIVVSASPARSVHRDAIAAGQPIPTPPPIVTVHEGDARLGVGVFEVVEPIFVEEEGAGAASAPSDVLQKCRPRRRRR